MWLGTIVKLRVSTVLNTLVAVLPVMKISTVIAVVGWVAENALICPASGVQVISTFWLIAEIFVRKISTQF